MHAIEPLYSNVKTIVQVFAGEHRNIHAVHAALGREAGWIYLSGAHHSRSMLKELDTLRVHTGPPLNTSKHTEQMVRVHRIDELFGQERLAFVHLDVEGAERDVVLGAHAVFQHDRPVFTVESSPLSFGNRTHAEKRQLLATVHAMGYRTYAVREQCGVTRGCINIICLPAERVGLAPTVLVNQTDEILP